MAGMYQAATSTLLTTFQVAQMGFDEVKETLAAVMDITPLDSKKAKDVPFLDQFYNCKNLR